MTIDVPWLAEICNFDNDIPKERQPFVRTEHLNTKKDGCFICNRKSNVTRHHIRRGYHPLAVYICRRHHDIIHGIALNKKYDSGKNKGKHYYPTADLRTVLAVASTYKLFKTGERGMVTKRIKQELDGRS